MEPRKKVPQFPGSKLNIIYRRCGRWMKALRLNFFGTLKKRIPWVVLQISILNRSGDAVVVSVKCENKIVYISD
jgi:hypothetical protein